MSHALASNILQHITQQLQWCAGQMPLTFSSIGLVGLSEKGSDVGHEGVRPSENQICQSCGASEPKFSNQLKFLVFGSAALSQAKMPYWTAMEPRDGLHALFGQGSA